MHTPGWHRDFAALMHFPYVVEKLNNTANNVHAVDSARLLLEVALHRVVLLVAHQSNNFEHRFEIFGPRNECIDIVFIC